MSSGSTPNYSLSYPVPTDPVNVAGDIKNLADDVADFLTAPAFINNLAINGGSLVTSAVTANLFNTNATTLNIGGAATALNIGNASGQVNFTGDVNVATGKSYEVNNVSVLNATTLGSSVVTSSLTSVGTIGTGTWNATAISANKGGTGITSYTVGDILYASTTSAISKLTIGSNNYVLTSNGSSPAWTQNTGTGNVVLAESPTLTGVPLAPTAAPLTNTTQIATTAFVVEAIAEVENQQTQTIHPMFIIGGV
jgi:hypothetical protein